MNKSKIFLVICTTTGNFNLWTSPQIFLANSSVFRTPYTKEIKIDFQLKFLLNFPAENSAPKKYFWKALLNYRALSEGLTEGMVFDTDVIFWADNECFFHVIQKADSIEGIPKALPEVIPENIFR